MVWPRIVLLASMLGAMGCATAHGASSRKVEPCPSTGDTKIGDYLECNCAQDNPEACDLLATFLAKEGGAENLSRAEELRRKACLLGLEEACSQVPGHVP